MGIKQFLSSYDSENLTQPYIIAEAGVNHEGSMDLAKRLIDEAKEGGADAIKFQTYKAETIASKDSPYYWDISKEPTRSQFELFKKYDKFWKKEFEELKRYCDQTDIEFLSTAFDVESAKFLNDLMPAFKISSSDLTNLPFIQLQSSFGKPIILSTGASELWEVQRAVEIIKRHGRDYCLMHCVLNYPTMNENANLGMIRGIIRHFPDCVPGYSDHTLPDQDMSVCTNSFLLGAVIIEKHFTHDKSLPGNDHYHAMNQEDLKRLRQRLGEVIDLLGTYSVEALPSEAPARQNARRSLVVKANLWAGHVLEESDLTWKRPAVGISPADLHMVLGKKINKDLEEDTVLKWWHLQEG